MEGPPFGRFEPTESDIPNTQSEQTNHFSTAGVDHTSYLPILTLSKNDFKLGQALLLTNERDPFGPEEIASFTNTADGITMKSSMRGQTSHPNVILFFNTKTGMGQPLFEFSVIGENQQSFTQEIETPSIKKVLKLLWQIVVEGSSAVSVLSGANDLWRLVINHILLCFCVNGFSVHKNTIDARNNGVAYLGDTTTLVRNTPGFDEFLGSSSGANTCLSNVFLQPQAHAKRGIRPRAWSCEDLPHDRPLSTNRAF